MIQAMIFDLDGTLVQTEKLKAISYAHAAVRLKPELDEREVIRGFATVVGLSRSEVAQRLLEQFELAESAALHMSEYGVDTPWQAFVQIRLEIYREMLDDENTLLEHQWPHNMALLERARAQCEKVGLATMSYCAQVQRVLRILDLRDAFDFVATRDDVENGKPDPEIYQLVARELDVSASECLVIEDSPAGVRAALAAGMCCIAVATPFTRGPLHAAKLIDERWIVDEPEDLVPTVDSMLREHEAVCGSL